MKKLINRIVGITGYQFCKIPSLNNSILSGKYKWLQDYNIKSVIDIGANTGQFALMINEIIPNVSIFSFEPLNDCFKQLIENTKCIKNIKCFNFAIGETNCRTTIYHNEFSPSSSLLKIADLHTKSFPHTKDYFEEEIEVRTLDSLESQVSCNSPVLMKIDVQGYELNVLQGAHVTLEKVDIILIEASYFELYQGQPLFKDIYDFLSKKDFLFCGNLEQVYDSNTNRILQSDSIFISDKLIKDLKT